MQRKSRCPSSLGFLTPNRACARKAQGTQMWEMWCHTSPGPVLSSFFHFSITHSYSWESFPLLSDLSLFLLLTVCAQCGPLFWDTRTWIVQQRVRLIHTCISVLPSLSLSKSWPLLKDAALGGTPSHQPHSLSPGACSDCVTSCKCVTSPPGRWHKSLLCGASFA